jgi:hypothetical protein
VGKNKKTDDSGTNAMCENLSLPARKGCSYRLLTLFLKLLRTVRECEGRTTSKKFMRVRRAGHTEDRRFNEVTLVSAMI